MENKKPTLLLIDDNLERRKKFRDRFEIYYEIYRYNFRDKKIEYYDDGMFCAVDVLPPFSLILIHAAHNELRRVYTAQNRLWYGGYGYDDTRIPETEAAIYEPMTMTAIVSIKEAEEIYVYFECNGKEPHCIKIPSENDFKIEKRIQFIDDLRLPSTVQWEKIKTLPAVFDEDCQEAWKAFYEKAINWLEQHPTLNLSHPQYEQYAQLINQLIKDTVEKLYEN